MIHISTYVGDITRSAVDAIVNAANRELLGGGGVDGAIHRAAGPRLLAACRELRATTLSDGLDTGEAVAVPGFDLPAEWVILTVGPIYDHHPAGGPDLLAACYRNCLDVAEAVGAISVAFPSISTGVYGWPAEPAARIAVAAVRAWAAEHPESRMTQVHLVAFSPESLAPLEAALGN